MPQNIECLPGATTRGRMFLADGRVTLGGQAKGKSAQVKGHGRRSETVPVREAQPWHKTIVPVT